MPQSLTSPDFLAISLKEIQREALSKYLAELRTLNADARISAILIGSVARGTETVKSDLDF
jgi:predicted nucleotidyltransferase